VILNNSKEVLDKLNEWLKTEYKLIGGLEARSHDHEEKIRLRAEHNILKKVLDKLDEFEQKA
jgi:hypothetical protein